MKLRGEIVDGLAVVLIAGFFIGGAFAIDLDLWDGKGVSPRFFPILLACIIALFGFLIVIRAKMGGEIETRANPIPAFAVRYGRHAVNAPPPLILIVVMGVMLVLVQPLGFPLMAAVSMFTLLQILRAEKKTVQNACIAASVSMCIFLVFYHGFRVYLPLGFGL